MAGFFKKLIGAGIAETAEGIGRASVNLRTAITGDLPPDAVVALAELDGKVAEMQGKLNIIEAGKSFFHSGWRPACGWIGVFGLFYSTIGYSLLTWIASLMSTPELIIPGPPQIDHRILTTVLFGLLGIGGMRSYEKKIGVQNKH